MLPEPQSLHHAPIDESAYNNNEKECSLNAYFTNTVPITHQFTQKRRKNTWKAESWIKIFRDLPSLKNRTQILQRKGDNNYNADASLYIKGFPIPDKV